MSGFTAKVEEARKEALKTSEATTGFSGNVRIFDLSSLEKNDEFVVEFEDADVLKQKMGEDEKGNPIYAEYIILQTKGGKVFNLYPGTFTKNRRKFNQDGTPVVPMTYDRNTGSAVDEFKKHTTIADAMNALKGKTIKVNDVWACHTQKFDRSGFTDATMYKLDIVNG